MKTLSPFVDVLGAISSARATFGPLQAAVGLRPRTPRAGRPFDVLVLLQNVTDGPVDAVVQLRLPHVDARGQKGQFTVAKTRILIGLRPAEVGIAALPVLPLASAAPGDSARFSVEVRAQALGRAQRIRAEEAPVPMDPRHISDSLRADIDSLRSAAWSANKQRLLPVLEAPIPLLPGSLSALTMNSFRPGWTPLWTPASIPDARALLALYGDRLTVDVFPGLRRLESYPPLYQATFERFRRAGVTLFEPETALISKLLSLLLEYAAPELTGHGYVQAGPYAVSPLLRAMPDAPPTLPRWAHEMLRAIDRDPTSAISPITLITGPLYPALIEDAVRFAFPLVERETGADFGTDAEQLDYARDLVALIDGTAAPNEKITFTQVYLPLILGGLFISDQMPISKEDPDALLASLLRVVQNRALSLTDDTEPLVDLIDSVTRRVRERYGFRPEQPS